MKYIVIPDTSILAINHSKQENESSNIVYCDKNGIQHSIDFETCAANYKSEHTTSSGRCIGERKMDEGYFLFYTSGMKTKVVFTKIYVGNIFHHPLLSGSKTSRFLALQNLINQTIYTTYDLA